MLRKQKCGWGAYIKPIFSLLVFLILFAGYPKAAPEALARELDSQAVFQSLNGGYSLPVSYSTEAVVEGVGSSDAMWEFVRRHSEEKLWTYVVKKVEIPKAGQDKFLRLFGDNLAQLDIIWSPKEYDEVKSDFQEAIKLHKQNGIWIDGSEEDVLIDGYKGISGRYKIALPDKKLYANFIIVHVADTRYQIQFSYTGGFTDPENTLEKAMQIKFGKPLD